MRLTRLLIAFAAIRIFEAMWIILSFVVVGAMIGQAAQVPPHSWTFGELLSGGIALVRYYFFAFGYLIASALVFLVADAVGLLRAARNVVITNVCAYLVHSLAVILAGLGGVLPPELWTVWLLVALYNGLLTGRIARFLIAEKECKNPIV